MKFLVSDLSYLENDANYESEAKLLSQVSSLKFSHIASCYGSNLICNLPTTILHWYAMII